MSTCRICACVDEDCTWCVVLGAESCYWVEQDLCSTCAGLGINDEGRAYNRGQIAWDMGMQRGSSIPGKAELLDHGRKMLRVWVRLKRQRLRCEKVSR